MRGAVGQERRLHPGDPHDDGSDPRDSPPVTQYIEAIPQHARLGAEVALWAAPKAGHLQRQPDLHRRVGAEPKLLGDEEPGRLDPPGLDEVEEEHDHRHEGQRDCGVVQTQLCLDGEDGDCRYEGERGEDQGPPEDAIVFGAQTEQEQGEQTLDVGNGADLESAPVVSGNSPGKAERNMGTYQSRRYLGQHR